MAKWQLFKLFAGLLGDHLQNLIADPGWIVARPRHFRMPSAPCRSSFPATHRWIHILVAVARTPAMTFVSLSACAPPCSLIVSHDPRWCAAVNGHAQAQAWRVCTAALCGRRHLAFLVGALFSWY